MANNPPSTQRSYAIHRLIEAASNYPTFYIHHIADMLTKHHLDEPEDTADNDQSDRSLPKLTLGYGRTETGQWKPLPDSSSSVAKNFVLKRRG